MLSAARKTSSAPAQSAVVQASRPQALLGNLVQSVLSPLAAVALVFGLWEWAAIQFDIPLWLVPKPSDFLWRLVSDAGPILGHAWATSLTLAGGFVLGVVVSVPLALLIVSIPALERGLFPVIVFLNIMPKTIIGPILIIWFGIGPLVSVLIVFLMCFFPVMVDAMAGFRQIDKRLLYITRSMNASRWQTFRYVRLPASMTHVFAGMRIGIVKAVEGVIIAEFIASNQGLGFMIMQASSFMDTSLMFSGIIAAAIVALIFNGALSISEHLLMPWAQSQQ